MLSTFNCGVGFMIVAEKEEEKKVVDTVQKYYECYEVGKIAKGRNKVVFSGSIDWK